MRMRREAATLRDTETWHSAPLTSSTVTVTPMNIDLHNHVIPPTVVDATRATRTATA